MPCLLHPKAVGWILGGYCPESDAVGSRVIMDLASPKLGLLRVEGELVLEGLEAIEVAVWVGNTGWRGVERLCSTGFQWFCPLFLAFLAS